MFQHHRRLPRSPLTPIYLLASCAAQPAAKREFRLYGSWEHVVESTEHRSFRSWGCEAGGEYRWPTYYACSRVFLEETLADEEGHYYAFDVNTYTASCDAIENALHDSQPVSEAREQLYTTRGYAHVRGNFLEPDQVIEMWGVVSDDEGFDFVCRFVDVDVIDCRERPGRDSGTVSADAGVYRFRRILSAREPVRCERLLHSVLTEGIESQ